MNKLYEDLEQLSNVYSFTDEEMEKISSELNSIQLDLEKSSFGIIK